MTMQSSLTLILASFCCSAAFDQNQFSQHQAVAESAQASEVAVNPIRRVVSMLQSVTKKIEAESKKEQELYDKYMCYCKNAGGSLQGSIDAATNKVPQVESSLKESASKKAQLEQEVKDHQSARAEGTSSMATSTALREKEAAEYAKEKSVSDSNIAALQDAISAIVKGMTGFLQTSTAQMLQRLTMASDLNNFDRQMVMDFLTGKTSEGYVPQSAQITCILKQLEDTMTKDRDTLVSAEQSGISSYDELMSAKGKEVAANKKAIENKSRRVGELGVKISELNIDLDDTQAALGEDSKFLQDMDSTCAAKTAEWAKITQARGEEMVAIAETIKILNDDDALELFKKALPSPSFVQEITNSINLKRKALGMVQELQSKTPQRMNRIPLDLISVALSGKKVNFEKVLKLIDSMVVILGQEQEDDNSKQEYCKKQFDFSDDKKKGLLKDLKDLEATMADNSETIATLTDELKALSKGIADLDKEVAESTENRKDEHQEHSEFMSSDAAAKELLEFAKNRLNQYYNPTLYKAPTDPAAKVSLVEISEHRADKKDAPEAAPDSFKAYKKSDDGKGVVAMLEAISGDLDKEMTEAESTEKGAQKEYMAFMTDAAEKRADDSKTVTDKEGYKADAETGLETAKEGNMAKVKELMATEKYISGLHAECDFLITNFEVRKEARAGEIEALKNAKAILNGADLSLLQQSGIAHSLRGSV